MVESRSGSLKIMGRYTRLLGPWIAFFVLFLLGWRVYDWFDHIPYYSDHLEVLWAIRWYGDSLFVRHESPLFHPLSYFPEGRQVATLGSGPGLILPLLALDALGGGAFALNVSILLSFVVAFAGMFQLARRVVMPFPATLAGLLSTFWGWRWYRVRGHLNVLVGSACLPWMVWCLERALHSKTRSILWCILTGVIWAGAIAGQLYFVWIGGIVLVSWLFARLVSDRSNWRTVLKAMLLSTFTAVLLSAPLLIAFWQGRTEGRVALFNLYQMDPWGASVNSLPIPSIHHPWLGSIARSIYRGPTDESGVASFGLVATLVALSGLVFAWNRKVWRPVVVLVCVGLLLALGLNLKWDGTALHWSMMRPLNNLIWQLGHVLKPGLFASEQPPPPFAAAIPMPALVLTAILPFWEGARVLARYAVVAALGLFLLTSLGVARLRSWWLRLILAAILLVEVIPQPTKNLLFPASSHLAFEWLERQTLNREGVVDLYSPEPGTLQLLIRGSILLETLYHRQATASGAGQPFPEHTALLLRWFHNHPHPFEGDDLVALLYDLRVRFIVLHMIGSGEWPMLEEAQQNERVHLVRCFPAANERSPWNYEICVLKVLSSPPLVFDVAFGQGWSDREEWGRWAEGTESRVQWLATSQADHLLHIEAFPFCVDDQSQQIYLKANTVDLASHRWTDCEPWVADIVIPDTLVQLGWNELSLHYGYAASPHEVTAGVNGDRRLLSVGFTKLVVDPREPGYLQAQTDSRSLVEQHANP